MDHAYEWLIFPQNIGPHVSIDETCLSTGEVYTIVSNKDAHGRKGCLIAVVKGTKAKDVIKVLKKIEESLRMSVVEVTLDRRRNRDSGRYKLKHHNYGYTERTIHHIEVSQGHEPPEFIYKK